MAFRAGRTELASARPSRPVTLGERLTCPGTETPATAPPPLRVGCPLLRLQRWRGLWGDDRCFRTCRGLSPLPRPREQVCSE